MVMFLALQIKMGKLQLEDVPEALKDSVKQALAS